MSGSRKKFDKNDFLGPLPDKYRRKKFIVFDLESKDGDSQKAGFTRPFAVGMFDPNKVRYQAFRNDPHLLQRDWYERTKAPGSCIDKFMTTVLTKAYSRHIIYAHNGGKFDQLFILPWLRAHDDDFTFELVPIQSSIQAIRVWPKDEDPDKPNKLVWEFLDTLKLLPMSLAAACNTFDLRDSKGALIGKLSHDLNLHEDHPLWDAYLKQDCIALATVMTRYYELVESLGGDVGMTTPATAMRLFRKAYLGKGSVPKKLSRFRHWEDCKHQATCTGCAHAWMRKGYYGGRTELHRTGQEMWTAEELAWIPSAQGDKFLPDEKAGTWDGPTVHYYDINSSYVATLTEDMPTGNRVVEFPKELDWARHDAGTFGGYVECTVEIPETCEIPPLPHPDRKTGKLLFPAGRFHGVWPTCELSLLRDPMVNGRILHISRVVWHQMQPLARDMMLKFWGLRDKTNPDYNAGLSAVAKLLGNSFYGKFGMKHERSQIVFERNVDHACILCGLPLPEDEDYALCHECEGSKLASEEEDCRVWYQSRFVDAPYIMPHISAWVTARARVRLWEYMKEVLVRGGKIYYTDTDSIITDVVLPSSPKLGDLKDEYPGDRLRYLGIQAKAYMIERVGKNDEARRMREILRKSWRDELYDASTLDSGSGGLPFDLEPPFKPSAPKVTLKGFPPAMRTAENMSKLRHKQKLEWKRLEQVRTLARRGFRDGPKMVDVEKQIRSAYDKRVLLPDGSTKPRVMNEPIGGFVEENAAE